MTMLAQISIRIVLDYPDHIQFGVISLVDRTVEVSWRNKQLILTSVRGRLGKISAASSREC